MKTGGRTVMFLAVILALALTGTAFAVPGKLSRLNEHRKEYLFGNSKFYEGENIFFARDVVGGLLETADGKRYDKGVNIGAFTLAPGKSSRILRITGEKSGTLNYKRNIHARYRRFEAVLSPGYAWKSVRNRDFVGTCQIFCDGIEVFSKNIRRRDAAEKISVDLSGVKKLEIRLQGKSLCFLDPFLMR